MQYEQKHTLTADQVKKLTECQGHCARARKVLDYLADIGVPDEEGETRHRYLLELSQRMLEIHNRNVADNRRR